MLVFLGLPNMLCGTVARSRLFPDFHFLIKSAFKHNACSLYHILRVLYGIKVAQLARVQFSVLVSLKKNNNRDTPLTISFRYLCHVGFLTATLFQRLAPGSSLFILMGEMNVNTNL